jgi:hypothetical protein
MNLSPQTLESILADIDESERLHTLTNKELVRAFFEAEDDELIVLEMVQRLDPSILKAEQGH